MILPFKDKRPSISPGSFVAPDAALIGDVEVGGESSIWFGAVLRGDINPVRVGSHTNIQDQAVLHVDHDAPCIVGDWVTVGHGAVVHGATIEDGCLIGIGATVLSRSYIGRESVIGAGAVVTEDSEIPPQSVVLGIPAKVCRSLEPDEQAGRPIAESYVDLFTQYRQPS